MFNGDLTCYVSLTTTLILILFVYSALMGHIERTNLGIVRPTEYFKGFVAVQGSAPRELHDDVIAYLLWFHLHGQGNYFGHPVGEKRDEDVLVVDGHHRLVTRDLLGIDWDDFYFPDSKEDVMTQERIPYINAQALEAMNKNIIYRIVAGLLYDAVDVAAKHNISTIRDLRMQYPHLADIDAASDFYDFDALKSSQNPPRYPCNVDLFA